MSRLAGRFAAVRAEGRAAFVTFITAGDPDAACSLAAMRALVASGADVIELGVPFSDPMADGPVIQRASERALAAGASMAGVLDQVRRFRAEDDATPIVLMGYLNPIEQYGPARFAADAAAAGVDGLITVDLPPEEASELADAARANGIDLVYLLAPTTAPDRIADICRQAGGFVYYVSLKGVTGSASIDVEAVAAKVREIRGLTSLPVGVGFGIGDAESAGRVAAVADAVVVGTALVRHFEANAETPARIPEAIAALAADMRRAIDAAARRP
ncbi:MAG: tryptophan synthase subunit alpha [Ectothiorhodospiraceae bacterium]|nr:tryptophan synthase subunit alpha [Chromatiales bacterium]MCP5156835.1 tryptophan synthase subunit alpha [Ectothiorhodospiraceae bacterium]